MASDPGACARAGAGVAWAIAISVGGGPKTIGGNGVPGRAVRAGCDGGILGDGGGATAVICRGGGAALTGMDLGAGAAAARGGNAGTARLLMAGFTEGAGLGAIFAAGRFGVRPRTTSSV